MISAWIANRRPITIVTGGGRGIGAATAVHLARSGHDVVVNYRRDQEAAGRVARDGRGRRRAGGRGAAPTSRSEDDVERLFAAASGSARAGRPASSTTRARPCISATWRTRRSRSSARSSTSILSAVILCARRAAQVMSTQRGGAGVRSSTSRRRPPPSAAPHEYVHYAAAKARRRGADIRTVEGARSARDPCQRRGTGNRAHRYPRRRRRGRPSRPARRTHSARTPRRGERNRGGDRVAAQCRGDLRDRSDPSGCGRDLAGPTRRRCPLARGIE